MEAEKPKPNQSFKISLSPVGGGPGFGRSNCQKLPELDFE